MNDDQNCDVNTDTALMMMIHVVRDTDQDLSRSRAKVTMKL